MNIRHFIYVAVMRSVNLLFPKKRNKIMLGANPSYSDNCRAFYEYLLKKDRMRKYQFVWVVDDNFKSEVHNNNTRFIRQGGLLSKSWFIYLFHLYTSKTLVSTHSFFTEANPLVQKSVCTWHGTMLKRICKMNEREKNKPVKSQFSWFVSPSEFYRDIFAKSFGVSKNKVKVLGYPRNDFLFEATDILDELGIEKGDDKIIAYLPTFRIPKGGGYEDCVDDKGSDIFNLSDHKSLASINERLKTLNIKLIIKLHPYDSVQYEETKLSNIFIVPHKVLAEKDCQLYHLLHYADALITDYSSVFCDYLILDRPIAFVVSDMDEYGSKRGFVFDNPLEYLPGSIIRDNEQMMDFIEEISQGMDSSKDIRQKLQKVYNEYLDNSNSKRLADSIGLD